MQGFVQTKHLTARYLGANSKSFIKAEGWSRGY